MDRSLDEIIAERPRPSNRNRGGPRRGNQPRDGVKKSAREDPADLDMDWVHDKFEDDRDTPRSTRGPRGRRAGRHSPSSEPPPSGSRIRVNNLHYDLTEDDLNDLFTRIGSIVSLNLLYDRAGRSEGIAFVTYKRHVDAQTAVREFDGANAKGQPIHLTLVPSDKPRNPFDTAERPKGTLFERSERPRGRDTRSLSPEEDGHKAGRNRGGRDGARRTDRYVPSGGSPRRRNDGRSGGRRPGEATRGARERNGGARQGPGANERPKKTREELNQEMQDYFGGPSEPAHVVNGGEQSSAETSAPAATNVDEDIDMIE